jgi:hypothetical protein
VVCEGEKAKERNVELQNASIRVRDLVVSRDKWKAKAKSLKMANELEAKRLGELSKTNEECRAKIATLEEQTKKGRSTTS